MENETQEQTVGEADRRRVRTGGREKKVQEIVPVAAFGEAAATEPEAVLWTTVPAAALGAGLSVVLVLAPAEGAARAAEAVAAAALAVVAAAGVVDFAAAEDDGAAAPEPLAEGGSGDAFAAGWESERGINKNTEGIIRTLRKHVPLVAKAERRYR